MIIRVESRTKLQRGVFGYTLHLVTPTCNHLSLFKLFIEQSLEPHDPDRRLSFSYLYSPRFYFYTFVDHPQVAATDTGLVLQLAQTHVGPPVAAAHLLFLLVAVRLVAGVGAASRSCPLDRDNIGVNSIIVGVIANTVVYLLQTKIQTV